MGLIGGSIKFTHVPQQWCNNLQLPINKIQIQISKFLQYDNDDGNVDSQNQPPNLVNLLVPL
jgi:hypothetical protein